MRVSENRSKLARRLEETRPGAWVAELGRRIEPQARFFWNRVTPGELGLEFTTIMAFVAVSLFVVIGFGIVVSGDPGPTPGDTAAFEIVDKLSSGWLDDVAEAVTELGSGYMTLAVALVVAIVLGMKRMWAELIVTVIAVARRPHRGAGPQGDRRAAAACGSGRSTSVGISWPSGHAAYGMIYAWIAFLMAVRANINRVSGTVLILIGLVVSAAVGLSRVYLRVHYLSDVNSGAALAVAAFAICSAIALLVVHFRDNEAMSGRQ